MLTKNHKNIASLIHISAFTQLFIPFGSIIGPLIMWVTTREKSEFIDANGKEAVNFQISLLLYTIVLALICIPFAIHFGFQMEALEHANGHVDFFDLFEFKGSIILFSVLSIIAVILIGLSLYGIIMAAIKANEGEVFKYPLRINFIK